MRACAGHWSRECAGLIHYSAMKKRTPPKLITRLPNLDDLSPVQRLKKISVQAAADFNDTSEDTFRRNHGHLIQRVGKRKQAVTLIDAILLPPPER
jgi:hypothetical protein